ncbi:tetratricopeptide repeat protein [Pelagovum pacificum]|nr:tetratricopeptide repeat protein [Pelagovum pacificum]
MRQRFKLIVTSAAIAVGISVPAYAQETLDEMFEKLATAAPDEARRIEERIADQWSRSGSAAIDLLFQRGRDALDADDPEAAVEHFTAVIDFAPDFAEAYHGRATAYFLTDEIGPAIDDLREVLALNPRQFAAMRGLGIILEDIGRPEQALEVYEKVLAIHPHMEMVPEAVHRVQQELEGIPL